MKRAQINQVFIYIFALIIIGVIVLVGVRAIVDLLDRKCETDTHLFKDRFPRTIREANGYRGVETYKEKLPCSYDTICLIDARVIEDETINSQFDTASDLFTPPDLPFVIQDSIESQVKANVFLIDGNTVEEVGFIAQLQLEDPTRALCIRPSSGTVNLLLTGQGRTTEVSAR